MQRYDTRFPLSVRPDRVPASCSSPAHRVSSFSSPSLPAGFFAAPVIQKAAPAPNVTTAIPARTTIVAPVPAFMPVTTREIIPSTPVPEVTTLVAVRTVHTVITIPVRTMPPVTGTTPALQHAQIIEIAEPGDSLTGTPSMDFPKAGRQDGAILEQTASDKPETVSVNGEEEDEPFVGGLLVGEAARLQTLAALREGDPTIRNISGDENTVTVESERHAKVLGLFSIPYTQTVTVNRKGILTFDDPWWLIVAQPEEPGSVDLQDSLQKPQQLIQVLTNIAKTVNDDAGMGNTTRKIGGASPRFPPVPEWPEPFLVPLTFPNAPVPARPGARFFPSTVLRCYGQCFDCVHPAASLTSIRADSHCPVPPGHRHNPA
ncbi:MAG: hypothetical protein Q8R70_11000 [Methanoregula sp.]|nr:hypothetical protein [Methanoregula sp.]